MFYHYDSVARVLTVAPVRLGQYYTLVLGSVPEIATINERVVAVAEIVSAEPDAVTLVLDAVDDAALVATDRYFDLNFPAQFHDERHVRRVLRHHAEDGSPAPVNLASFCFVLAD